jgi:hypothetical protein
VTVTVPASEPEPGDTASHGASSVAVQLSDPTPPLETASVLAAGLAPPCTAVKLRLPGVTAITGASGSLTQVIGRVMSTRTSAGVSARS